MNSYWHLYLIAIILIVIGIFHLIKPKAFMRIMPRYIPFHRELVYLSGCIEIIFGIALLIPQTKLYAAWGVILMLISFFPVHIYMITNKKASLGLPKWILYFRLLLQLGLIAWAYLYT